VTPVARRLPIRTRLALLYTGLMVAALVVFGTGVYVVMRDQLVGSFDAGLLANAEHAGGAFAQDVPPDGTLEPARRLLEQFASTGGRVVVLARDGSELADSAPAGASDLPVTSEDLASGDRHARTVREGTLDGDVVRLVVEPIIGPSGERVGYVVWVASTRDLRSLLGAVGAALVIGGLVVTVLALAAGWLLARKALAPIADVTETARAIALSGDFAARVEAGQPGDEVGELAVAFNEMLAALDENHAALQRFLGDASHQLRTPLTTIRANLDLARRPDLPEGDRRELLDDARSEAERMGRLISDLLALARADSGARLEFVPVELDAVLVESVRQQRLAHGHVRFTVRGVEPALVDGDRDRLKELFLILLDNAARYTPEGGSVAAGLEVRDGRALVTVSDTGVGISDEDRPHLFERLYRGRRAREMRPSGTGLGLPIARWIAETHGGTIRLENRDGGGTVATVALPVRTA
jgi:signal transduction histidine kinase